MVSFQSREGWAAALLLFPDLPGRVLGEGPGLILATLRDLLLRPPLDTSPVLTNLILDELAESDMNALAIPIMAFIDGRVGLVGAQGPGGVDERRH